MAILLAVVVRRQENPERNSLTLPVNLMPPPGTRMVQPPPGFQIRVDLEGPADAVNAIRPEEVALVIDTSQVKPGKLINVPVSVEFPEKYQPRVRVNWWPRTVPVKFESDARRQMPIVVRPLNPPDGWEFTAAPQAAPARASVTGSGEAVNRVVSVSAPLLLEEAERINALITLQALDANGNNITGQVQVDPPQVVVSG